MSPWRVVLLFALCAPAWAQSPPPPDVADLPAVVVSGVQPGPGLWKVSRPDPAGGGHVMWVLGTLSPLPRSMQWRSSEVEQAIAGSQQVLRSPAIRLEADVGFIGKLFLLPSAYRARKNPDGERLQQLLPPAVYARWQTLKQKYRLDKRGVERWRPMFAAQALFRKALAANGLSRSGGVAAGIDALAQRHGVPATDTSYHVVIEHPRAAIKAFKQAAPHDVTCFIRTLDSIEHDMPAMAARANAWATGDLQVLRELPDSEWQNVCVAAVTDAGFAHTLGLHDVPARLRAAWLAAATKALDTNEQTFAVLPMDEVLRPDGYLGALQALGYQVDAPE